MIHSGVLKYEKSVFNFYQLKSADFKTLLLNIPLISWDLESYSVNMVISAEEIDNSEFVTVTQPPIRAEYATNFSLDGNYFKKIGLKFGTSAKKITSQPLVYSGIKQSNNLGSVTVRFGDLFLLGERRLFKPLLPFPKIYRTQEYSSDKFSIGVEPKRVQ